MLLAFYGWTSTGKTTAAQYLKADYGFESRHYATELRRLTATFGKLPNPDVLMDAKFKASQSIFPGKTWRDVMLDLGAWVRKMDPNYFINALDISGKNVTVDDVRTVGEYKHLRVHGAVLVRIFSGRVKAPYSKLDSYLDDMGYDHRLDNSEELPALYDKLDQIMQSEGIRVRS